jgi:hypothetical protein
LRYWAAREYNGFEIGEQLIDEMYEILGMENELSTMNFTSMGLFENKYILDSED